MKKKTDSFTLNVFILLCESYQGTRLIMQKKAQKRNENENTLKKQKLYLYTFCLISATYVFSITYIL